MQHEFCRIFDILKSIFTAFYAYPSGKVGKADSKQPQKGVARLARLCYIPVVAMREELAPNEDIIFAQQNQKVVLGRGSVENKPRQLVSVGGVIAWHVLVLAALDLWLLRLLGYITLPW